MTDSIPQPITESIPQITAEEITQHISAMRDSVTVINEEITKEPVTKEIIDTVNRNVQHLELMLEKEFIVNSEEDFSDIVTAVIAGKDFVNLNIGLLAQQQQQQQ